MSYCTYIILEYTRKLVKSSSDITLEFTMKCNVFGPDRGLFVVIPVSSVVQRSVIQSYTVVLLQKADIESHFIT